MEFDPHPFPFRVDFGSNDFGSNDFELKSLATWQTGEYAYFNAVVDRSAPMLLDTKTKIRLMLDLTA